jgi:signal transduction histidine kinase
MRAHDPWSASALPGAEDALLHVLLAAVSTGATVDGLVARLEQLGVRIGGERLQQLLAALVARHLIHPITGVNATGYVPTTAGLAQAAALETRAEIETELADLERLRTQLLGVVGHELRTPLTAIRTSVGLLQDPGVQPSEAERDRLLENIARGAERIQRLVADVLDIARFRAGEVRLQLRTFDAAELAEGVTAAMAPALAQKRQHLRLEIPERPMVFGDRIRLRQVLFKLLSNAHRFAPPGAAIAVRLKTDGDDIIWSVADRGPGISAEDLPRLFERFFAPDAPTLDGSGAGLGLPISLAIAQAHGGTIEVETAPGIGSTFSLRVPLRGPEEAEP